MATIDLSIPIDEAVKPYLHKRGPVSMSRDPINETAIRYFCEVTHDGNPVYWDPEFAKSTRFGRVIAPPQSILTMSMAGWWTPDYLKEKQAQEVPSGGTTEEAGMANVLVREYGYTTATVVNSEMELLAPFGPGDGRIKSQAMVEDVSSPKRTRVGEGVFVTSVTEFSTEKDDRPVARLTLTVLMYNGQGPKKDS